MKHTPGPWFLKTEIGWSRGAAKQVIFHFYAGMEPTVPALSAPPLSTPIPEPLLIQANGRNAEADARLAVRAPELLEALEEGIEYEERHYLGHDTEPGWLAVARALVKDIRKGRRS